MGCVKDFATWFVIGSFLVTGFRGASAEELPLYSWLMPFDVNQRHKPLDNAPPRITNQDQIYDFMWESFVAGMWPWKTGGNRGEPDRKGRLAPWNTKSESQGPVVWQTWRRPNTVFVRPKDWSMEWNAPAPQLLCLESGADAEDRVINASTTNYSNNSDGLNQPFIQANYPTGPVADQNGKYLRYEVALNQSYFSYIGYFRYYKPKRQIKSVKRYIKFVEKYGSQPPASNKRNAKTFQELPNGTEAYLVDFFKLPDYALQGIVEVKVAWKILGGDDNPARFYWRNVFFYNPDGSCTGPVPAGLIAVHIHRVTQFGHIGATFEQVDNTNLQPEYSSQQVPEAAALPPHASLNPGGEVAPIYDNGYEVCDFVGTRCESGFRGLIPPPIKDGASLSPTPSITNIARQVPIPDAVQRINAKWRKGLEKTVWFYYQMIGTQNKNLNVEPNSNLGPGVIGPQSSNANNLINTGLESYTQKGYSCAGCHQNAFPQGVTIPFPPFEENFAPLHTISFLLQNAISNKGK